jgi:hypothetical protein
MAAQGALAAQAQQSAETWAVLMVALAAIMSRVVVVVAVAVALVVILVLGALEETGGTTQEARVSLAVLVLAALVGAGAVVEMAPAVVLAVVSDFWGRHLRVPVEAGVKPKLEVPLVVQVQMVLVNSTAAELVLEVTAERSTPPAVALFGLSGVLTEPTLQQIRVICNVV